MACCSWVSLSVVVEGDVAKKRLKRKKLERNDVRERFKHGGLRNKRCVVVV